MHSCVIGYGAAGLGRECGAAAGRHASRAPAAATALPGEGSDPSDVKHNANGSCRESPPENAVNGWQTVVSACNGTAASIHRRDAIKDCGALLAEHFPPGRVNRDELPNHLIVLE